MGMVLTNRTKDSVTIIEDEQEKTYSVLIEFPFDSTRKRMTVIIKQGSDYYLLTKGADNIMKPRINWEGNQKQKVDEDLNKFAIEGLRTLVMAKKQITQQIYQEIQDRIDDLESSVFANKEDQIFEVYDQYEQNLTFIGASAIEDKLQDDVAVTISILMEANIRLWVLTGDKQETAIEIAKSCQLIQEGMQAEILTIDFEEEKLGEPIVMLTKRIHDIVDKYGIKTTEE
jgi:phospholipid-translocating ATPase